MCTKVIQTPKKKPTRRERGFTLIELLTIIGIMSILTYLSLTSFWIYKDNAGYASAESMVRNARAAAAAGTSDADNPPPAASFVQATQGQLSDPNGYLYLPGLQVPRKLRIEGFYDPDAADTDIMEYIRADSCFSREYTTWTKWGDGVEILLEHVAGADCQAP